MGMTNFELFAIVVFGVALLGFAAWRQIKRVGQKFEQDCQKEWAKHHDAADKVSQDAEETRKVNLDLYNEACNMEPFCGGEKQIGISAQEFYAKKEAGRLEAVRLSAGHYRKDLTK